MTPEEIKAKVQDAHRKAMASNVMWSSSGSGVRDLLRDVRLFGREAGADFVETNLDALVREAVTAAERRAASLEIPVYGFGRAAVEGVEEALRRSTGLVVEGSRDVLRLIWANPAPGYV